MSVTHAVCVEVTTSNWCNMNPRTKSTMMTDVLFLLCLSTEYSFVGTDLNIRSQIPSIVRSQKELTHLTNLLN